MESISPKLNPKCKFIDQGMLRVFMLNAHLEKNEVWGTVIAMSVMDWDRLFTFLDSTPTPL